MTYSIKIILASIREGRFGVHPAQWALAGAQKELPDCAIELLDLRDYMLPVFAEPVSPKYVKGEYRLPEVNRWAEKIAEADAFLMVTPEYNHGYPSSLKNNIDYLYKEWGKKPVAYIGYGLSGGASSISQLRTVATELEMVPMRTEIYIKDPWNLTHHDGSLKEAALDGYTPVLTRQLEELSWWACVLRDARVS